MRGRAAPPHPGIYGVPPRESYAAIAKRNMRGKKREETGALYFSPTPHHRSERLEQAIRDRVESGLVRSKEIESGPSLRRVLHDRGKKRVK